MINVLKSHSSCEIVRVFVVVAVFFLFRGGCCCSCSFPGPLHFPRWRLSQIFHPGDSCGCQNPYPAGRASRSQIPVGYHPHPPPHHPILGQTIDRCILNICTINLIVSGRFTNVVKFKLTFILLLLPTQQTRCKLMVN